MSIPITIGVDELGAILGKARQTIYKDLGRNPAALPPPLHIPGSSRTRWLMVDVLAWLEACRTVVASSTPSTPPTPPTPPTPKRGAPSKEERLEAGRLGVTVQELRRRQGQEGGVA